MTLNDGNRDYGGILNELTTGKWRHPKTGNLVNIKIKSIVIKDSLDGEEADLVNPLHPNETIGLVCDKYTYVATGKRIYTNLKAAKINVKEIIWKTPVSTKEGVDELRDLTRDCDSLIAVGSGTINDSVKYATFQDGKKFSVFPTSPQNAYTTSTASISFGGFKKSLKNHFPQGVFFDIGVISKCPPRLVKSAFSDIICRTTAQVDWLTSHLLFNTDYSNTPYILLAYDEHTLFSNAGELLKTDRDIFGMLIKTCALMGLGTSFTGSTNCGSMGEHMMSHYIDMFAEDKHPKSLHGEQVGVCSLTMSLLQNLIVDNDQPPIFNPVKIEKEELVTRYGEYIGLNCLQQLKNKAITREVADRLNKKLEKDWKEIQATLKKVMLPTKTLWDAMEAVNAIKTYDELGLDWEFYEKVVLYSREIRERFTYLDIATSMGILSNFTQKLKNPIGFH